jgi:KaiC/GvpD/RAD55 family RecA-like ATPase
MLENDCDEALKKFETLMKLANTDFSEADTRAKILDPLFKDVLGWSEDDIVREPNAKPGYLDYLFKTDKIHWFVLEAKKTGTSFAIPTSFSGRSYKINGVLWDNKPIRSAIEQTQDYCVKRGARYGIVSNGTQFILFEAFRSNDDWRNGHCIVFHSLDDIRKDFGIFWEILNKRSVKSQGSLRKHVSQENIRLAYLSRPIDRIHGKNLAITRNNISQFIQPFVDYVFSDITKETQLDVLRNCYVLAKPFETAVLHIRHHFDRPPGFAKKYKVETILEFPGSAGNFEDLYSKCEKFLRTDAPQGSLVLLMGGIGCGKTTFIHHFFNFVIKKPENALWFYVDFLEAPTKPDKIEDFVIKRIVEEFERKYFDKLKEALKNVGIESISPDLKNVTVLLSILVLKGYTISLVLDNVDQHSYVSPEYQERVFLIAKYLTDKLKTLTILTLREESFFRSTLSGVLDSFPLPVFHIASPAFEDLMTQRINYILRLLEKENETVSRILGPSGNFEAEKSILQMFFEIVRNSLSSKRPMGQNILTFLDDISGGNMRLALYFFSTFLLSGNTNVDEMLTKETREREKGLMGYQIPIHHMIKSIILEHSRLYSSSRSRIMNLFNFNPEETSSHFMNLRILQYLWNRASNEQPEGRGFASIGNIIEEGARVGVHESAIANSLREMAMFSLVQFENQSKDGYERALYVRITNTGTYYLERLVKEFAYLDLIWMDTPISKQEVVDELLKRVVELRDTKRIDDVLERFERTELFLDYLKETEEAEFKTYPEYKESDLAGTEFIPGIVRSYKEARIRIEESRKRRQLSFYAK